MATETLDQADLAGLSSEQLLDFFRTMHLSRFIDDREMALKRQNKIFFQISGAGHEAIGVGVAAHLDPAKDWSFFYYRDRAFALSLGQTPLDHLLQAVAAEDDPASGGRQMPAHYSDPRFHIANTSSPTGTQFLQAVGAAEAGWRAVQLPELQEHLSSFAEDEIVVCTTGDGTTSEGEFWEALNTASNLALPVLFVVEDNEYAISVPVEVQTAGGSISKLVEGFPGLKIAECDGTDPVDVYRVAGDLVRHCRERKGPALLHAHCTRPYSHSMSDDERMYRPSVELERQAERDCLQRMETRLLEAGIATREEIDAIIAEAKQTVADAAEEAVSHPQPDPSTAMKHLYSEEVDPTGESFATDPDYEDDDDRALTMLDLVNRCLSDEMARDSRIVVFGEDVADASREDALGEVKGKGGVFKATHGLQQKYGSVRVFNSPLAEANIVGRAFGMATRGLKPVVEIQFFDYIWPAFHQIRNELATIRYRSAGTFDAPVVIRTTYGGYLRGGAIYHSQTGATLFTHIPGLRVVIPSNAEDANGLLRTAIRCDDPVLFLEHKHLYRQVYNKGRYPGADYMIPFGRAHTVKEGTDLTLVTCGALVKRSMDAVKAFEKEHDASVEVIDLRTLSPLDMETVAASVKKTNRALVVHEDAVTYGHGAEIAAQIADGCFAWLDAPVKRVGALDTWVAYAPQLEEVILPQAPRIRTAIEELLAW
ncbi:MAG: dehydrogenase E1 component subunit alpha/beta [Longimicrobiales bacterium]|nr:dehydrogenase E1 component subunit alpha/beta [Longimicrobiales bacterium]